MLVHVNKLKLLTQFPISYDEKYEVNKVMKKTYCKFKYLIKLSS